MMPTAGCTVVFIAEAVRTFAYGFLGIVLPVYLSDLGVSALGIGGSVSLTLLASAALTWAVRRPAERYGARPALLGLVTLSAVAAGLLLCSTTPSLLGAPAMLRHL